MPTTETANRARRKMTTNGRSTPAPGFAATGGRGRGPAVMREQDRTEGDHEAEYDLLTAALIGATIGAGMTYLLRQGPGGRRPVSPIMKGIGRGARWAADRGSDLWDRVPHKAIRREVSDYAERARDAIDDAVESELKQLRKSIRRQRKRLGF